MSEFTVTGSDVYASVSCLRKIALRWSGDREQMRETRPHEEFLLKRGRDLEDEVVRELGWPEPEGRIGEHEALAASTAALLRDGVPGVLQGVLLDRSPEGTRWLGIADLLRRVEGESAFGDWHYEVVDVKSSRASRSDQILQVVFYSRLLEGLQERAPLEGGLILRDGSEERFRIDDFAPAIDDVLARLERLADGTDVQRPFLVPACSGCRWGPFCRAELEERDDLSLVAGMTPQLRGGLEAAGVATAASLASADLNDVVASTGVEVVPLRRLQRAARARVSRKPEIESRVAPERSAGVYAAVLTDDFDDRLLWIGLLSGDELHELRPTDRDSEWREVRDFLDSAASRGELWHHGRALPRWIERRGVGHAGAAALEARCVDLAPRLRGAAVWPEPIFSFDDQVRLGLDLDPEREGPVGDAARQFHEAEDETWLSRQGERLLRDIEALDRKFLRA